MQVVVACQEWTEHCSLRCKDGVLPVEDDRKVHFGDTRLTVYLQQVHLELLSNYVEESLDCFFTNSFFAYEQNKNPIFKMTRSTVTHMYRLELLHSLTSSVIVKSNLKYSKVDLDQSDSWYFFNSRGYCENTVSTMILSRSSYTCLGKHK